MFHRLLLLFIVMFFSACASLPHDVPKTSSYSVDAHEETIIGLSTSFKAEQHPGDSGFYVLPSDIDAYIARAVLIDAAERTLDMQYYIVNDDLTVSVLTEKLLNAANRGVRVRLLFDGLGVGLNDCQLWLLNSHPNIELRLFNPVPECRKGFAKFFTIVGNFKRLNHRMHNKAFIVDNVVGILGGRNLADAYFGAREDSNFADMDVMAIGPVVRDISKSFDIYWNSEWAIPFEYFESRQPEDEEADNAPRVLQERNGKAINSKYAVSIRESDFLKRIINGQIPYSWAKGYVVYDLPGKISDDEHKDASVYLGM